MSEPPSTDYSGRHSRAQETAGAGLAWRRGGRGAALAAVLMVAMVSLRRARRALFVLGYCAFIQALVHSGLTPATLAPLGRRYRLSAAASGAIVASYDVAAAIVGLPVAALGGKGGQRTKARALALGMATLALGAALYALPSVLSGKYDAVADETPLCAGGGELPLAPPEGGSSSRSSVSPMVWLLAVGNLVLGAGASPVYVVGPALLQDAHRADAPGDEIGVRGRFQRDLAVVYAMGAVGPAAGFVIAGMALSVWVDGAGEQPLGLDESNPLWVGQWAWPFFGAACAAALSAALFWTLGRFLGRDEDVRAGGGGRGGRAFVELTERRPSAEPVLAAARAEEAAEATEIGLVEAKASGSTGGASDGTAVVEAEQQRVARGGDKSGAGGMRSWLYAFLVVAQAMNVFGVAAVVPFLPLVVQTSFGVPASRSSLLVGAALVPAAAIGSVLGGLLVKRFRMSIRTQMAFCGGALVFAAALFVAASSLLTACGEIPFAGVSMPIDDVPGGVVFDSSDDRQFEAQCNAGCGCELHYTPVCHSLGEDNSGVTFFNGCVAGCASVETDPLTGVPTLYQDCACAGEGGVSMTTGECTDECDKLLPFLGIFFLTILVCFLAASPISAILMAVSGGSDERAMALAVGSVIFRLLGAIPAPVVEGVLIDRACTVWEPGGACLVHDRERVQLALASVPLVALLLGAAAYFSAWKLDGGQHGDSPESGGVID